MKQEVIDIKLMELVTVCVQTGNLKKIAVTYSALIRNKINEMSIKLGLPPIKDLYISKQMMVINEFTYVNFDFVIFQENLLRQMKKCELVFIRTDGDMPLNYIKMLTPIYYELRKIIVPNLNETIKSSDVARSSEYRKLSLLSSGKRKEKDPNASIRELILSSIKEKLRVNGAKMNQRYNYDLFSNNI